MKRHNFQNIHLNLNTDAVDSSGGSPAPVDDILGEEDWSKVDRSMPLLPDGLYELDIADLEMKTNEKTSRRRLAYKLVTTKDVQSPQFGLLNTGFPVFGGFNLDPTDKQLEQKSRDQFNKEVKRDIALFLDSCGMTSLKDLSAFKGLRVAVKVTTQEEKGDFPASNRVRFVPPAKGATT